MQVDICNVCGTDCSNKNEDDCIEFIISGSKNSKALDYSCRYHFTICDFCLNYFFSRFKNNVVVKNYNGVDVNFIPVLDETIYNKPPNKEDIIKEYYSRNDSRNSHLLLREIDVIKKVPGLYFGPDGNINDLLTLLNGWDLASGTSWCQKLQSRIRELKKCGSRVPTATDISFQESIDILINLLDTTEYGPTRPGTKQIGPGLYVADDFSYAPNWIPVEKKL